MRGEETPDSATFPEMAASSSSCADPDYDPNLDYDFDYDFDPDVYDLDFITDDGDEDEEEEDDDDVVIVDGVREAEEALLNKFDPRIRILVRDLQRLVGRALPREFFKYSYYEQFLCNEIGYVDVSHGRGSRYYDIERDSEYGMIRVEVKKSMSARFPLDLQRYFEQYISFRQAHLEKVDPEYAEAVFSTIRDPEAARTGTVTLFIQTRKGENKIFRMYIFATMSLVTAKAFDFGADGAKEFYGIILHDHFHVCPSSYTKAIRVHHELTNIPHITLHFGDREKAGHFMCDGDCKTLKQCRKK